MRIHKNDASQLEIHGNIKSPEHVETLRSHIDELLHAKLPTVHLMIHDSFSITSSVIHFFSELVHAGDVVLHIQARDPRLYRTLENLGLVESFNVRLAA